VARRDSLTSNVGGQPGRRSVIDAPLALAVVAHVALAGCVLAAAPTPQQLPNGSFLHYPQSSPLPVGTTLSLRLFTHCGVDRMIDFAGVFWESVDPAGRHPNPPAGFGNPYDDGRITLRGPGDAVYVSSQGRSLALRPRPAPVEVAACD
jgi:hypothetical protein